MADEWDFGPSNEEYWRDYAAKKSGGASVSASPPRSAWEVLTDSIHDMMGGVGTGLNPSLVRGNQAAREEDLARQSGSARNQSPKQVQQTIRDNQERRANDVKEARASRALQMEDEQRRRSPVGRAAAKAAEIAGSVIGDINPTYAIGGFGANALERILGMGAITGANDIVGQGDERLRGIRDRGDPVQTLESVAGGALLQGAGEGAAHVVKGIAGNMKIHAGATMPNYGDLFRTMMNLEGGGTLASPKISKKGAKGPAQVMDATARDPGFGIKPWDGKTEADRFRVGYQYLAALNHEFKGEEAKVLAAYNAGPGRVKHLITKYGDNWLYHLPDETKKYVVDGTLDLATRRHAGPEDLGQPDIVAGEQPSVADQAHANDKLAELENSLPKLEDSIHYENDPEIIPPQPDAIRPAVRDTDGNIHIGNEGDVHMNVIRDMQDKGIPEHKWGDSGFVDKDGNFLTKGEAGQKYGISDASVLADMQGPMAEHLTQMEQLDKALEAGIINWKEYDAKLKELGDRPLSDDEQAGTFYGNHMLLSDKTRDNLPDHLKPLFDKVNEDKNLSLNEAMALDDHLRNEATSNSNVHDLDAARHARDYNKASNKIDEFHDKIYRINKDVVDGRKRIDPEEAEYLRATINNELRHYAPGSSEHNKLLDIDDMLKEAIAHSGGKPRLYEPDATERFLGGESNGDAPANDLVERDANPPASSSSFGTQEPEGINRKPPTKSPEGHDEPQAPRIEMNKKRLLDKLGDALEQSSPIRREAEAAIAKERARRLAAVYKVRGKKSGEAGFHAELASLKGSMGSPKIQSIRHWFTQPEIDSMYDIVNSSTALQGYDTINAKQALKKLLGADYGEIPTAREVELLARAMPRQAKIWRQLLENEEGTLNLPDGAVKSAVINTLGLTRTLKASFDVSAPGRQGLFLIGSKEYWKALPGMYKSFASEGKFHALQEEIRGRDTFDLMNKAGLQITRNDASLADREEAFISQFAEKIPGVRNSERAYLAFLNKLRADMFDDFVKKGEKLGIDFIHDPHYLKSAAKFINSATGRGDLGSVAKNGQLLANVLFSPKLMKSRIDMLNPFFYAGLHPKVRLQAAKHGLIYASMVMSMLGLAGAAGLDIEKDMRSSDFAKIKIKNTRFDVTGGFQPYVRFYAQFLTGQQKGINDGLVRNVGWTLPQLRKYFPGVDQGAFKPTTRKDLVYRFFENKESPNASEITRLLQGSDAVGNPLTVKSEAENLFAPLIASDTYHAWKDLGNWGLLAAPFTGHGGGVQTYTPKVKKTKAPASSDWDFDRPAKQSSSKEWDF